MPKLTVLEKKYIEGYKKFPENDGEANAMYLAGLSSFSSESWEADYRQWKKAHSRDSSSPVKY